MDSIITFYIGLIQREISSENSKILCVSTNLNRVRYYLKFVRKLSNFRVSIQSVNLPMSSANMMYDAYMLEEYTDEFPYLTRFDLEYLQKEIADKIDQWNYLLDGMRDFLNELQSSMHKSSFGLLINGLNKIINLIQYFLQTESLLMLLEDMIIEHSVIFSSNINRYLEARYRYFQNKDDLLYSKSLQDEDYT